MVEKLDHIGIAVENLAESIAFYRDVLGIQPHGTETVQEQKVNVAFFPVGDTEIELLESTDPEGPIAKFIAAKGQGIQHIAFRVADIEATLDRMRTLGVRLIDEKPRYGAGGAKIAFLHPKSTNGVLVELCQRG